MNSRFTKILDCFSRGESLSLRIILFRIFCISIAFVCLLLVVPANMLQDVSPYLNPVTVVYAAIVLCLYRISLAGKHFIKTMYIFTMLLLNICWFLNGGSTGSIGFFFLTAIIYPLIFCRSPFKSLMLLLLVCNYSVLVLLEKYFPSMIVHFVSRNDRYLDILTGFAVSIFIIGFIFWVVVTSYDRKLDEQRRAEEDVRESEEKYRILFENNDDAIFIHDESRILAVNPSAFKRLCYTEEELMSLPVTQVGSNAESVHFHERTATLLELGHLMFETVHRRKDGSLIPTEVNASRINWQGQPAVMSSCRDITERKRAEEELQQHRLNLEVVVKERTKDLEKSELRYRTFVENVNDVVFSLSEDGIFTYLSPNWLTTFGYEPADTLGTSFLPFVHPDDVPGCVSALQQLFESKVDLRDVEYRVLHRNGSWIWYSANASLVQDPESDKEIFLGIGRDISDRKKAEEEKLLLEREFLQAQKLESLGVMAGGIAHDFNNLQQSILGNIEMALRLTEDPSAREHISTAMIAGKQATNLTGLMLTYAGKGFIVKKELNLNELIMENAEIFRSAATTAVSLELSLSKELPEIFADRAQIQQLAMNLIINAAEAIEKSSGFIRIETGVHICDQACLEESLLDEKPKPGHFLFLKVSDNGCGMDEMTMKRLFDPFFTTKFTGRGLGMSAVMGIMKIHGGALFVKSEPGEGTTFKALFPLLEPAHSAKDQSPPAFAISSQEKSTLTDDTLSGVALVVDDEKSVLKTCKKMVEICGFRVITAGDGIDAITIFKENADIIDVVIMDMTMPNMDGITAMYEIYRIKPESRIILASGFNKEDMVNRISQQPSGFINKPYSLNLLEAELRRVMADRSTQTEMVSRRVHQAIGKSKTSRLVLPSH